MPADYGHAGGEDYAALTTAVALWDVGAERQVELSGPDALRFADYLVTSDLSGFTAGRCKYTFCCDERGVVICDPVLLAVEDDRIWLSHGNIDLLLWAKGIALHTSFDVNVTEPDVAPMQIQGPRSQELMAGLVSGEIEQLPYYRCMRTRIDGADVVVSRTGWSGGLGYEIYPLHPGRALDIWHRVIDVGAPLGLVLAGPNVQRAMECGITDTSYYANLDANALEMGRPRAVDLDKGEFIGREALREVAERGPGRTTVGLIGPAERLPRAEDVWRVMRGGLEVGQLRWSTFSPALERAIAIAMLDCSASDEGTEVVVVHPDGETPMTVTALPFVRNT
jgi:glycine cleavage system aminomethyltransferase T